MVVHLDSHWSNRRKVEAAGLIADTVDILPAFVAHGTGAAQPHPVVDLHNQKNQCVQGSSTLRKEFGIARGHAIVGDGKVALFVPHSVKSIWLDRNKQGILAG